MKSARCAWTAVLLSACAGRPAPTKATAPTEPVRPPAAVAPAADPKPPELRLPGGVRPTGYDLRLAIDPERPDFEGEVSIALALDAPTRFFWLHAQDLTVRDARLIAGAGEQAARAVSAPGGFLGIGLAAEAPAGPAALSLRFAGKLDDVRSRGIYRVAEPDGHRYAYSFFEATDARRAFPCFDEPGFKVPWRISISAPAGAIAASNAPLASEIAAAGGGKTFVFEQTPPLPPYLVAFVVGPFDAVDSGTVGEARRPLRFLVPGGRATELRYAREVTPRVVALLESWFGIPYPFAKLDVAVVPRYWGTMEHPGIVAMGQPLSLIKPDQETVDRKQTYANILAHELGHYWFGDLVTMAWWDETWLNEGMTTWIDRHITRDVDPRWKFERSAWSRAAMAMSADSLAGSLPVRKPVVTASDVEAAFDNSTTYYKGDAVLGMFEAMVGPEVFRKGVRRYLERHAWGNATSKDLLAALDEAAGAPVSAAIETFIDQPGVPEVSLSLSCAPGAPPVARLTQKRYRPLGQSFDDQTPLWRIPVCLRHDRPSAAPVESCRLAGERAWETPLDGARCPRWLHGNTGGRGYYHVRYDAAGRRAIVQHRRELTPAERHAFLRDLGMDLRSGALDVGEVLADAPRFLDDADAQVVGRALALVGTIDREHLPDALLPRYRRMVRALAGPLVARLGFAPRADEPIDDHDLRQSVLGMVLYAVEDPALVKVVRAGARAWLADRKAIDHDLRWLHVVGAARFGDAALFDAYLAEAARTTDRDDRRLLYGALGAFRDPALSARALDLLLDRSIDIRESGAILATAMSRRETRARAWSFLEQHFDDIAGRMRDDEKAFLFALPRSFCDREHRADAEAFLGPRAAAVSGGAHALRRALEGTDVCIAQRERNAPGIARFLRRY